MDASDLTLLERFVSHREEAAFLALVKRHGPRVQGTCRRVLHNEHDVEDVFQATFMLLARKAPVIAWQESIGNWLCAVAHRLALSARADASRQRRYEAPFAAVAASASAEQLPERFHPLGNVPHEIESRDLSRVVADELRHLPEKYRAPVVLCDLEGRTHQEAALALGWPSGSISRRLSHARSLLRHRLVQRGVGLTVVFALVGLAAYFAERGLNRAKPETERVRLAMIELKRPSSESAFTSPIHTATGASLRSTDSAQILAYARRASTVAAAIVDHNPGKNREAWRNFAIEMGDSALLLAQATEENNPIAGFSAARRLDASCLKCHEVFGP